MTMKKHNILIIGSGGREHAIAWKVAQSPLVGSLYIAPGNAGTALDERMQNIDIASDNILGLLKFAQDNAIDLTIVGPEVPLALGVVDQFEQAGLACLGPNQAAAQLESSKQFSKDFMAKHHIPTANYETFTDITLAKAYLESQTFPIVIKADGLAAGKGVVIAQSREEANAIIDDFLTNNTLGEAGSRIVIESFLEGEEASFMVLVDGDHILPLATSKDHKKRDEGDQGPNTGGMGAYSPAPIITDELCQKIMTTVIKPTIAGLQQMGIRYRGFLYAGLMIGPNQELNVLEFNCRLGDPETQVILPRLKSDLVELALLTLEGKLEQAKAEWDERVCLGVVLASGGYPGEYLKGLPVQLSKSTSNTLIFHAGTTLKDNQLVSNGGRVLCVSSLGANLDEAHTQSYTNIANTILDQSFYRRDIGKKYL